MLSDNSEAKLLNNPNPDPNHIPYSNPNPKNINPILTLVTTNRVPIPISLLETIYPLTLLTLKLNFGKYPAIHTYYSWSNYTISD